MEPELIDAIGDYLLAHVERHGHARTAETFGVSRHTLWRFLERGQPGRALPRSVTRRTDIPRRIDVDAPKNYRQNKHVLFGQQEGRCGGCAMDFPFKIFEVDHVISQSRGGTDHIDNLQLLCSHCNRVKGDRPQEYLVAQLAEMAG